MNTEEIREALFPSYPATRLAIPTSNWTPQIKEALNSIHSAVRAADNLVVDDFMKAPTEVQLAVDEAIARWDRYLQANPGQVPKSALYAWDKFIARHREFNLWPDY